MYMLLPVACLCTRDRGCTLFVDRRRRRLECPRRPRVTSRLVDALKAMDSQLATRTENMAITSSFGDLGVVLNAPTIKRDGLITCIGYYLHLSHAHLGFSYVILINAYVVNHYTCTGTCIYLSRSTRVPYLSYLF